MTVPKISLEQKFDITFTAKLAQREKQIQQNYRPIIGVHKWFARRPGTVFRNLLLSEYNGDEPLSSSYWRAHSMQGVIADPFMGGGTPIYEANRLGFSVVGTDINPMAYWVVRQSLSPLNLPNFKSVAEDVIRDVESAIADLYKTTCNKCGCQASVKYFIWVKTQSCPSCHNENDLFPGYLLAEDERHPRNVLVCSHCGDLDEHDSLPTESEPATCRSCGSSVLLKGPANRNKITCRHCETTYPYPPKDATSAPSHRMWAIEFHCSECKKGHEGRFFKRPDAQDLRRFNDANELLVRSRSDLPIPDEEIPLGSETRRLHRWGYSKFQEMFNARQLFGLGTLLKRIDCVEEDEIRHALLTVFSDFLRYQNMLCRYDTYALKCQDIFSVHGFPVGLVQCENNLLGIPRVGSGAFRHFIEKYVRAKEYCEQPFETLVEGKSKKIVPIPGEKIKAHFVSRFPGAKERAAFINAAPADSISLPKNSLDGVFTDPPYFDNVQYAELMDFCYAWLRLSLGKELPAFSPSTTKAHAELTGNETMGRGLDHFTEGLSAVFSHYASALKPGAPFVFTYHHNDPLAYTPLVVAILDAGLDCTATLPAPAEMGASLHIAGSKSSVLDSIFVCRKHTSKGQAKPLELILSEDAFALESAGLKLTEGDLRCLAAGHIARMAINALHSKWDQPAALADKMRLARELVEQIRKKNNAEEMVEQLISTAITRK